MPVYWKPRYATRGQRHRAWARADLRREAAAGRDGRSLRARLRALVSR